MRSWRGWDRLRSIVKNPVAAAILASAITLGMMLVVIFITHSTTRVALTAGASHTASSSTVNFGNAPFGGPASGPYGYPASGPYYPYGYPASGPYEYPASPPYPYPASPPYPPPVPPYPPTASH